MTRNGNLTKYHRIITAVYDRVKPNGYGSTQDINYEANNINRLSILKSLLLHTHSDYHSYSSTKYFSQALYSQDYT